MTLCKTPNQLFHKKNTHSLTHSLSLKKHSKHYYIYIGSIEGTNMKVISMEKPQSKVGGEMMKSSLQQKSQHDTIIANILRLQCQYQHTSASSSYTHRNGNQYSTRFSKISPSSSSTSPSSSLSTDAPIIAGPTKGQLPSVLENHNFTNAAELRVTHDAILAYDAQLNSEVDDLILHYSTL